MRTIFGVDIEGPVSLHINVYTIIIFPSRAVLVFVPHMYAVRNNVCARGRVLTGVGHEVEAGELVPLLLEVALETLLAFLQLRVHHLFLIRSNVRLVNQQLAIYLHLTQQAQSIRLDS